MRARQRPEVSEAHGDRDGPAGAKALALEPREGLARQPAHALEDEGGVQRVHLERLLLADRLRLPLVRDGAVGKTAGLRVEILAPAAEPLRQLSHLDGGEVADGADAV